MTTLKYKLNTKYYNTKSSIIENRLQDIYANIIS